MQTGPHPFVEDNMSILDKTRKILWAQSGNRCAICKEELVLLGTARDDRSVVGDECHIISREPNGPRHDPSYPVDKIETVENLILLCRVHHKQVDDQVEAFTIHILRQLKCDHERWVREKLSATEHIKPIRVRPMKGQVPDTLKRLTTSAEVLNLALNALGCTLDHDESRSPEEVSLVGEFLQEVRDLADLWHDMEPSNQVQARYDLARLFDELETAGFMVFGAREIQALEGGILPNKEPFPIAHICVLRKDNPLIMTIPAQVKDDTSS
jgi:hypothetical protein